jgi:predicted Fe-Mo cluster-binding NifX family protein
MLELTCFSLDSDTSFAYFYNNENHFQMHHGKDGNMRNGRVAIPSVGKGGLEGQRSGHFGHCDVFTIVDVKEGKIEGVSAIPNGEHSQGGCLVPVNLLSAQKVNALIAGGMGMRPLVGFRDAGIDVYFDTENPGVKESVDALLAGSLEKMTEDNVCGGGHH